MDVGRLLERLYIEDTDNLLEITTFLESNLEPDLDDEDKKTLWERK